jgi:PAP2 superfamily
VTTRRFVLVAVLALILSTFAAVASTSVLAVEKPPKPKPALPKGPGPFHPFNEFGSRPTDNVVLHWNDQALVVIRMIAPPPPVTARALAVMNTAMYDAWTAYDATAVPTQRAGWARRPAAEHTIEYKSMAISYAAERALRDLFPSMAGDFTAYRIALGYTTAPTGTPDDPATVGTQAADAVLAARHGDGSNQLGDHPGGNGSPYSDYTGYTPTNPPGPLTWQPLPGQSFIVPHWRHVAPFALTSADQFLPPGPGLKKSDGSYDKAIKAIIGYSAKLDDKTKARAEYWADGPRSEQPPGHWVLFAGALSRKQARSIDQDVKLNFALGNALLDAGITSWNAKRRHDFIRPVTAVRTTHAGKTIKAWAGPFQGTKVIPAEQFRSYIPTPPHPDYVSGHSTFSAAAAQVIRSFAGSDTLNLTVDFEPGASFVEPGAVPAATVHLGWSTLSAAAGEAGLSRELGGIHFRDADQHGLNLGRAVGTNAWNKAQTYFLGVAPG